MVKVVWDGEEPAAVTGLPGIGAGISEDDLIEQEAREALVETFRTPYKKRVRVEEENQVREIPEMYSPVLKDDLAVSPDILASCLRKVETFVRDKFVSHESWLINSNTPTRWD